MTIEEWLTNTTGALKNAGIESARLDASVILSRVLDKPVEWLRAHYDEDLSKDHLANLSTKITQRKQHIPVAYIINQKEFYGRQFYVDEHVLIPRPESEAIIELLQPLAQEINTVIDVGTGSGCLAITAKLEFPNLHVTATDLCSDALKIARKNAKSLHANIQFVQSDLLNNLPQFAQTRRLAIIANLPYVPQDLITSEEITKEPAEALFSGMDGLEHYRSFWNQLANMKHAATDVFVESLQSQHAEQKTLALKAGYRPSATKDLIQHFTLAV